MTANGLLPTSQLVRVEGQRLSPSTALAYEFLKDAAAREGHRVSIWAPVGGYRDRDTQLDMQLHPSKYNLLPGVVLAPVGQSTHGQGRAVDIRTTTVAARNWVRSHAIRFGFTRPMPTTDPDHYVLGNPLVTDPTPAPTPQPAPTPVPEPPKDEDMTIIIDSISASTDKLIPSGMSFVIGGDGVLRPLSRDEREAYTFWAAHDIPFRLATWPGETVRALAAAQGVREWSSIVGDRPQLTGRILYGTTATPAAGAGGGAVDSSSLTRIEEKLDAIKIPTTITGTLE